GYERTLRELGRLAFSNIADVVSFNAHSVTVKDSGELDDSVLAAIRKISFTERATDFGATTEVSVDMHAKEKALAQLCKFHGIGIGFEAIRAALKVYGFALIQDPESELGWKLEPYEPAGSSPDA
ncbi:MAG: terminase small subunit, partial [Cyanobacteria bacterium J06639_14]